MFKQLNLPPLSPLQTGKKIFNFKKNLKENFGLGIIFVYQFNENISKCNGTFRIPYIIYECYMCTFCMSITIG